MILLGVIALGGVASAVVPGANGRIVFARETCTAHMHVHDRGRGLERHERDARWPGPIRGTPSTTTSSPTGRLMARASSSWLNQGHLAGRRRRDRPAQGVRGSRGHGVDDGPAFTPDGKHIVFTRCCDQSLTFGYDLWMINSDGTGLKDSDEGAFDDRRRRPGRVDPQVSPDGKHIAFTRCFPDQPCVVATVNINGGNLQQITDNSKFDVEHPNWSPDSKKIVFEMQANGLRYRDHERRRERPHPADLQHSGQDLQPQSLFLARRDQDPVPTSSIHGRSHSNMASTCSR